MAAKYGALSAGAPLLAPIWRLRYLEAPIWRLAAAAVPVEDDAYLRHFD
jgi:hypothetical protein